MITNPRLRVSISKTDHSQGLQDAPLVLIKYGDYECPFCSKAYRVVKQLQEVLKKDLLFVFRNFPLTTAHPYAMDAARAAEAAGLQGKFWEMHDMLYENHENLDMESLFGFAATLDLDLEKFKLDMRSQEVEEKITRDFNGGVRSGVSGTPGFYINGFRYVGDWSYPSFLGVLTDLRSELSEESSKKAG